MQQGTRDAAAIPEALAPLFWDVDVGALDLRAHGFFILERLMLHTTPAAYRWLVRTFPEAQIREVLRLSRQLDARSRSFWRAWLDAAA